MSLSVLFGPSGAGKSTIITIISAAAGLLRPDECRIVVDDEVLAAPRPASGCRPNSGA
jgi:ABC-type molybdate transport system ATPase subunit